MTDIMILYLIFAIIGLGIILLTLPTMIARKMHELERGNKKAKAHQE
jgi:hypothetical protein